MSAFKNMRIKHRILALVFISLATLGCISLTSIYTMQVIGDELADIAEQDIPLTEALQDITIHQLEQAVITERLIGVIEVTRAGGEPIADTEELLNSFTKLGHKIEDEIKDAEERSVAAQLNAHDEATRQEFVLVSNELKEIEVLHAAFDRHVLELADMAASGASLTELHALEKKIKEEEDKLDHSLTDLLHELAAFTEHASKRALQDERNGLTVIIIISVAALLVLLISAFLITTSIVGPLRSATNSFKALSKGDLSVKPAATMFNDEVREMNTALENFRQQSITRVDNERDEQQAREKRTQQQSEMNQLVGIFGASIGGIFELVSKSSSDMTRQSETMVNDAMTTRSMTDELLGMSETTSENAQQVSAATEEMVASIKEIATQADSTSKIADEALTVATKSADEVRELKEAADKIGTVIGMINDIAEQTNLLALNATIEAARAGDAGKGFAVVANEVKALATQTANATAEIADQIQGIQTASGHAADNIQGIGDVIGNLNELSSAITAAITQQEATTQEIAQNISSVAEISQQVSAQLEDVRASAQNSETIATQVGTSSRGLETEAISLGGEVDTFLDTLRNAGAENQDTVVAAKKVDLEASLQLQDGTRSGRLTEISPSHVLFSPAIDAAPGTPTTVVIGDWGQTISARVSEKNSHGTYLQLPLNHEHIAKMREKLAAVGDA
ncbi:methyl-accepting chemotaxis protein [Nisaea sp.]|uniref:methyl-accepting chemotaxis protein n=1 Tax=Nisaea sp. TaxID=2024842 RepID=UPI0032970BBF